MVVPFQCVCPMQILSMGLLIQQIFIAYLPGLGPIPGNDDIKVIKTNTMPLLQRLRKAGQTINKQLQNIIIWEYRMRTDILTNLWSWRRPSRGSSEVMPLKQKSSRLYSNRTECRLLLFTAIS